MDPTQVVVAQLIAIRAAADAALSLLVAEGPALQPQEPEPQQEPEPTPQGCQHPPTSRRNTSTMGHATWTCLDCGHEEEINALPD